MEDKLKKWLKTIKLNESAISMLLGVLVILVVGVLIYNYFTSIKGEEMVEDTTGGDEITLVEENGKLVPAGLPTSHSVAENESLWDISLKYYGNGFNWVDIAEANNLANPDRLAKGQELTIPRAEVKVVPEVVSKDNVAGVIEGDSYTVSAGDNLWQVAVRAYQDGYQWNRIYEANKDKLRSPDLLENGMVLSLPR